MCSFASGDGGHWFFRVSKSRVLSNLSNGSVFSTASRGLFVSPLVFFCFCFAFPKSCQAACVTRGSEKSESSKPIGTRSLIYFWSALLFSPSFRHRKKNCEGKRANCRVEGVWFSFQAALFSCLALPEREPLRWGEKGGRIGRWATVARASGLPVSRAVT